jgi:hypothetical protein
VRLQEFDRQAGAIFGFLKGVVFCIVLTFFTVTLSQPAREAVLRSRSGYYIALIIRRATPVLPQDLRDALGKYIDRLNQNLPDPTQPRPTSAPGVPAAPGGAKTAAPAASGKGPAATQPAAPATSPAAGRTTPRVAP